MVNNHFWNMVYLFDLVDSILHASASVANFFELYTVRNSPASNDS